MKIKINSILLLLSVLGIFLFSCGKNATKNVLIIGVPGDTDSFNPLVTTSRFGSEMSKMLFQSLLIEQPDFVSFKPALARSWEMMDNDSRIRFHLRSDVLWSDGVPLTAADVEFTFQLQTDPDIGWAGANVKEHISQVRVLNDSTIDFYFDTLYPYQLMDACEGVIVPKHIFADKSAEQIKSFDFALDGVFSGPYVIQSWVPNQFIELLRNEKFSVEGLPKLPRIVFKIVPDKTQLLTQLKTGEIHFIEGVPPANADFSNSPQLRLEHFPYAQFNQISWNTSRSLFASARVRRALTMSIDRPTLVQHLLKGYGKVYDSPIHPMLWAYNPDLESIPFDPETAKTLLKEEGWTDSNNDGWLDKNGKDFEFQMLTNIGSQVREDALVMIQEMLKKVGIKVIPQRLEFSAYVEDLMSRDFDALLLGMMSATKVDVYPIWHSSMIESPGFNLSCYQNKRIDEIIEQAPDILEPEKSRPLWYEFQEIIVQEQPATFLWIPERIVGMDKQLKGIQFSPVSTFFNIAHWYWE